jgi:hypothetical protein
MDDIGEGIIWATENRDEWRKIVHDATIKSDRGGLKKKN